jgi:hypothetical protein
MTRFVLPHAGRERSFKNFALSILVKNLARQPSLDADTSHSRSETDHVLPVASKRQHFRSTGAQSRPLNLCLCNSLCRARSILSRFLWYNLINEVVTASWFAFARQRAAVPGFVLLSMLYISPGNRLGSREMLGTGEGVNSR